MHPVKRPAIFTFIDAARHPPHRAPAYRMRCQAKSEFFLVEQALKSPDEGLRRWGLTELVRRHPEDGGKDALRCSALAAFVRRSGSGDHHALIDAVELHGVSPRMLPVFKELVTSRSHAVRLRAAPLWGTLIGLYRVTHSDRAVATVEE